MATLSPQRVLRQRSWTESQLQAAGFHYYEPVRNIVMARMIDESQEISATIEILQASSGDIICYRPDGIRHRSIDDYDHWPVKREIFAKTYRRWEDPRWRPNAAEGFLMEHGCLPYYKALGVWALRLPIAIYMQSLESPQPVVVPPGRWLCIGAEGEPYHMSDDSFHERYQFPYRR